MEGWLSRCKYSRYCRDYNPQNVMCLGEDNNRFCTTACQFRFYNEDHGVDEDSVNIEAKLRT